MASHRDSLAGGGTVLLIHGGLWEADMDAGRFWAAPGISAGLTRAGFTVLAPNRPVRTSLPTSAAS
ncbi:hypothetical protein [Streptomyces hoynatensis]|uniref:Alpha/beta hydrolase n=1 Tax=Streptomyces hoynatensis TaxID=1141874 RepID=A0A3A9YUF4_9ACTN|nr:hypothetical protein [Streptomyces hoynatensis]RKN39702.1 hypothetical protein D7294_19860 [Streptomyces hoynatensis]